ncbi:hypothetical protein GGF42_003763 [Coemansia sp. RSA 2424]|nr:hypothetical protein GGF42_003763 [Coemansia sp. RSA 2424]
MQFHTNSAISLAAALVAVQHFAVIAAMPDNDIRAGSPLEISKACPNAEGQLICANSSALLVCNHANWTFLSYCPEGTKCQNSQCINSADFTTIANKPAIPPAKPSVASSTPMSRTSSTSNTRTSSSNPSSTPSSNPSITSSSSTTLSESSRSSIPNIVEVTKLPIASTKSSASSKSSKPTGVPNISKVPELPISDIESDSSSSSAASKSSWTGLNIVIPVVSAIVGPCIIMLLL